MSKTNSEEVCSICLEPGELVSACDALNRRSCSNKMHVSCLASVKRAGYMSCIVCSENRRGSDPRRRANIELDLEQIRINVRELVRQEIDRIEEDQKFIESAGRWIGSFFFLTLGSSIWPGNSAITTFLTITTVGVLVTKYTQIVLRRLPDILGHYQGR
jgi:hypothetical protein